MGNIQILDCTLRDGGYVNNWDFGKSNIDKIIDNLIESKIDYIECGFLKKGNISKERSVFSNLECINELLSKRNIQSRFALMLNYGGFDIEDLPENFCNLIIRIAFKKENLIEALEVCKKIKNKGYDIFINPMHTNFYGASEILDLIKEVNEIKPYAFTIADTTGAMKEKDVLKLFYLIDNELDSSIKLCFHSHNNLQLSFTNSQALIKVTSGRDLIIDSTIFGMGRGAGNIQTEQLIQYLNDNCLKKYNLIPILKTIDEVINPIYSKTPWGYSVPYYLAATNHCHPNYAKFLSDKKIDVEQIDFMLKEIPDNKKLIYDENYIENLLNK